MSTAAPFDPVTFKANTRDQWNRSAAGWHAKRDHIRAWLQQPTQAMLDCARVTSGARVLDVAAGAGDQTLDIAERVGSDGYVLATDISERILQFAKENAQVAGYRNVDIHAADGEKLDLLCTFDAAICRLGLMFYPDPLNGLREIFRAIKPGGRACTLVFSEASHNPCIEILMTTVLKHIGAAPPDPYHAGGLLSLGKPGLVTQLFEQAGFVDVETVNMAVPMKLPSANDYLDFIRTSAGPILHLMTPLDDSAKAAAWADIADQLRQFETSTGWEGPNELLLTVGCH